jgi:hypothetical protein
MQDGLPHSLQRSWQPTISVVVPVFNEASGLGIFHDRLLRALAALEHWEVVCVTTAARAARWR